MSSKPTRIGDNETDVYREQSYLSVRLYWPKILSSGFTYV
jgi:hypothetical protein